MDVIEAIKNRRSIRKFKPDTIDDVTLETILEAAGRAPSCANSQCWRFIVVRDSNIQEQLSRTLIPEPALGKNPATNAIRTAPLVIVACAEKGVAGCFQGVPTTEMGDWYMFDLALAMENLVLAATSFGLGTVHVGLFDSPQVASILEVPQKFRVVEMAPIGYPLFQPNPRPRKELREIVFYGKFGKYFEKQPVE
jgi:nitroreductase